jgi:hydroxymethylpyrimidine pyrophosphatase-like HAD family hydrolase
MLEVLPVGHDKTTGFEALAACLARESGLAFRSGAKTSDDDARAVSNDSNVSNELRESAPFAPLRVVAVGDGENDAGMLRAAGVGVALANACEATKRAADHVTTATNDQDGVAEAIRKFVL